MKEKVLVMLLMIMVCSCTKDNMTLTINQNQDLQGKYNVSLNEAILYAKSNNGFIVKSEVESITVDPVVDGASDTLMYLVNYPSGGWLVISADKRIPAILAYDEKGHISFDSDDAAFNIWMKMAMLDIARVKQTENDNLLLSSDEINANKKRWDEICGTRGGGNLPPPVPFGDEVVEYYSYTEPVQVVPHMIPAQWCQRGMFNQYMPLNNNNYHWPVGCAGVASGQLLRYFYKKYQTPTSYGGVPMDSLIVNFSDVEADSLRATARYLKAINDAMGMHYGVFLNDYFSYAYPGEVEDYFGQLGYSCGFQSYDYQVVRTKLLNMDPVLVLAFDVNSLDLPNLFGGHYFLVDGFQTRREVYVEHHYIVGEGTTIYDEYYYYTYGSPYLAFVKMNWGQRSQWEYGTNDGWYSLTGSWTMSEYTYDALRQMLIFI